MSRTPTGATVLEAARKQLREAKSMEEFMVAQAVILPLEFGLSMKETGRSLGISTGWACQKRRDFIRHHSSAQGEQKIEPRRTKVRNRAYLTEEEESEFLAQFTQKAAHAGVLIVDEIHQALEQKIGHHIARATTYNLLRRQGWRKLAPDKKHPKADRNAQEDWKKNCPAHWSKSAKNGKAKETAHCG